jgi:hypothetical protein
MIRRALSPLARIADATRAAFVLIRHLGKGAASKEACRRGLGSMAIMGAMRTAFLVDRDPHDARRQVFACTKNNLAVFPPSLGFRIVQTEQGWPRIDWLGPVDCSADELGQYGRRRCLSDAIDFLQERLAAAWVDRQTLLGDADRVGIAFRTLERAKAELAVISEQRREHGRNVWYWALPALAGKQKAS